MDVILRDQHPTPPSRRPLEMASVWALCATIVLSVVAFIPSAPALFLPTKTFVIAAGALLTLALYILARLGRGNIVLPPMALLGALWLPTIAYLLSALFSGESLHSAFWGTMLESDTVGFMLAASLLGTLAALALRNADHYRTAFKGLLAAAVLIVGIQTFALLIGQFTPDFVSPAFSILGSSADAAIALGLIVVGSLLALRFLEVPRKKLRMLFGGMGLSLALLAVLNSSVAWALVALVAFGLFVETVMKRRLPASDIDLEETKLISEEPVEGEDASRSFLVPLVVLTISLFFLLASSLGSVLAGALGADALSVRPSWQSTLSVLQKTYSTEPLFGSGPSSFGTQWLKYRDLSLNSTIFWNTDFTSGVGFVPTSLVTTGLLGLLAWVAFFASFAVLGLRMLMLRTPEDPTIRFAAIFSFVAAVYLFAAATFDLPGPVLIALAFVCAGAFISTMRFAQGAGQWGIIFARAPRLSFGIVLVLTLSLLGSVGATYPLIENYFALMHMARANGALALGDLTTADAAAKQALALTSSPQAQLAQATVASARLSEVLRATNVPVESAQREFQSALSEGIAAALAATKSAPNHYQHWVALGNLYGTAVPLNVSGAYESSRSAYERAASLNPTNPQIPYLMAQLDLAHKDARSAEQNLKAAIGLKQDYVPAILLLSQIQVANGKVREALDAAVSAAYFTPNDSNILFQVGILRAAIGDMRGAVDALSAAVVANPQFANARYFLAAAYAKLGNFQSALAQIEAIAAISAPNANAVESVRSALAGGTDPFPSNLLSASSTPVQ